MNATLRQQSSHAIYQEKHDNDVAKLEKHLKAASLKPQHGELQALRLEVKRLEERLEDERVKSEEKQILQDQKIEKMAKELTVNQKRIIKLQKQLMPIHRRVLLDHACENVLKYFPDDKTWEALVARLGSGKQLVNTIVEKLAEDEEIKEYLPSRNAIEFLCSPGDVRKDGNYHAHKANRGEIKSAVEMIKKKRSVLSELYRMVYKDTM